MNWIYLLKASAIIAVLWLIYRLLLRKDTFFGIKRLYFIAGMFLSFLLPLWHIKKVVLVHLNPKPLQIQLDGVSVTEMQEASHWFDLSHLTYVWLAGVLFFLIKMLVDLLGIYRLIASGDKAQKNGFVLVSVDKDISPFSFGKYVVVNPKKFSQSEFDMLLAHEWVHVRQKHSLDVLLSGIFTALQWYNPFAWLWQHHLIENLEFIADSQATTQVPSVKNYQYLLLKTGMNTPALAMVNSFYKPNLKNRIMMLQQKKSESIKLFKFGILLPLIILFLYGFNTQEVFGQEIPNQHYVIDKHTTSKQLKDIENQINKQKNKFVVHFSNLMYIDEILVNVEVEVHYNSTGKTHKFGIQDKKGIAETILYIQDGALQMSQKDKIFSAPDANGDTNLVVMSGKGELFAHSVSKTRIADYFYYNGQKIFYHKNGDEIKYYDQYGKPVNDALLTELKANVNMDKQKTFHIKAKKNKQAASNSGMINYQNTTYYYYQTGKDYKFYNRFGTRVSEQTAKALQAKLTGGQMFIVDRKNVDLTKNPPLYVLDGKIITKKEMEKIKPDDISRISVVKGDAAIKKYGEKGKNGVVEIFTK